GASPAGTRARADPARLLRRPLLPGHGPDAGRARGDREEPHPLRPGEPPPGPRRRGGAAVSNTEQQHPFDEIAVYALDGLEPDEQAAIEAHLAGCLVCQAELDAHLATLPRLTPDEPASPTVWARITESIAAEGGEVPERPLLEAVPYPGAPPTEPAGRGRRRRPAAPAAAPPPPRPPPRPAGT